MFSQVFHTLVSSVSSIFFCMFQLLHLDVIKVEWVLHMGYAWEATGGAGDVWGGVSDVQGSWPTARVLARGPDALGCSLARCTYHLIWPSYLFDFN